MTGILLFLGFPHYDLNGLVWVGLIPLLLGIANKGKTYGFVLSLVSGICFFLGIFQWILQVPGYTYLHHAILALYLGSYLGLFGLGFCVVKNGCGRASALLFAPFLWVALEYFRSNMSFMALPWGLLGQSQHVYPPIIQVASLTGVYGVSFLIVLVSSAITAILLPWTSKFVGKAEEPARSSSEGLRKGVVGVALASIIFAIAYGYAKTSESIASREIDISVVQGNIEQQKKWDPRHAKTIMETYSKLTHEVSKDHPFLIVWPETAVPGSISQNAKLSMEVMRIVERTGSPLLLGSAQHRKYGQNESNTLEYYNSAFLITPASLMLKNQRYDKIRLFPFGEYLPMKDIFPWSYIAVPAVRGYRPGKSFTVFRLGGVCFATTICWENLFPDMTREFVRNGAQFIVNMTNEAWFGKTAAPYQFLSMNVFRAVENRVPVIRCANTGISCFIDAYGRVVGRVENNGEDIFVQGHLTKRIHISQEKTLYTLYGDWFAYTCIIVSFSFIIFSIIRAVRVRARPSGLSR